MARIMRWMAAIWLAGYVSALPAAEPSGRPMASVKVEPVDERVVAPQQTFVGEVVPARRSIVGSAVDGRIIELSVTDGSEVHMVDAAEGEKRPLGEPIAQLLTDTISIEIAAAEATLALRQQELNELKAGTRPEEISQAKARLEAAKAAMDFAKAVYARVDTLFRQARTVSREEFEQSLSLSLRAEQDQIAAQAAYEMAVQGPRIEQIRQAEARLAAAQEEVRRLEDRREKHTIRTPFAGAVSAKRAEVGQWVSAGDAIAEIVQLDPIEIEVAVPEAFITHVRRTAEPEISVRLDSLPDREFLGTVTRIVPQADVRARTFPVKITLPNVRTEGGDFLLKAGMLARATLTIGPSRKALLVSKDALILERDRPTQIRVVEKDPQGLWRVRSLVVQVGIEVGSQAQITGAVQAGQLVIVEGNERVFDGQPVNPVTSPPAARAAP